jgi:hypothetical protein
MTRGAHAGDRLGLPRLRFDSLRSLNERDAAVDVRPLAQRADLTVVGRFGSLRSLNERDFAVDVRPLAQRADLAVAGRFDSLRSLNEREGGRS